MPKHILQLKSYFVVIFFMFCSYSYGAEKEVFPVSGDEEECLDEIICNEVAFTVPTASNLMLTGTMEEGFTLEVFFDFFDADGDLEGTHQYQWYTHPNRFSAPGTGTPIGGATGKTYTIPNDNSIEGLHISVIVTPVDDNAEVGVPVEYMDWSAAKDNPVLNAASGCAVAGGTGAIAPDNGFQSIEPLCSPRNSDWRIKYTGIDHRFTNSPVIIVDWDDGNVENFTPTLQNPNETKQGLQEWEVIANHIYDYDGGSAAPTDGSCTFQLTTAYGVITGGGVVAISCPAVNAQEYTVWDDIGNANLGTHNIDHDNTTTGNEVGETVEICAGDNGVIVLEDQSDFNCRIAVEPDDPNQDSRWIQWVYGSTHNITTGGGATEKIIIDGVSYDDTDFPLYGTPDQQPGPGVLAPTGFTDDVQMPTSAIDGEFFIITLRSWNTCNVFSLNDDLSPQQSVGSDEFQYYGPGGTNQLPLVGLATDFANAIPITRDFTINIVSAPPTPIAEDNVVCNGTLPLAEVTAASISGGATAINFYDSDPTLGAATLYQSSLSTTYAPGTHASDPAMPVNTAAQRSYWVTQVGAIGPPTCESLPVEVDVTIREDVTIDPIAYGGADPECAGEAGLIFSLPIAAAAEAIGGATTYVWTVTGGLTIVGSANGQSVTVDIPAGTGDGTQTVSVYREYTPPTTAINPSCDSPTETYDIEVDAQSDGGVITGGNSPICEGESTGVISIGTISGGVVQWELDDPGAGGFVPIVGTLGDATISQTLSSAGTYNYRVLVQNGVCAADYSSNVISIVVDDRPSVADISGNTDICQSDNATLNIAITDGAAPYLVTIDNIAGSFLWSSSADDPVVSPLATTVYTITDVIDQSGLGCDVTLITGSATISVTNPTDAVFAGDASICNPDNTDLTVTITGGKSPYDITITDDQGSSPDLGTINNYVSGSNINTGALTATTVYTLTAVIDDDGCPVLGISDSEVTVVVGVAISAAVLNVTDVCDGEDFIFSIDITGGAPLYTIDYTEDGNAGTENNYVSGADINLGSLAVGVHPVVITLITDACTDTFGPLVSQDLEVFALPTANDQTPIACSDAALGTTATVDLTLLQASINGGAVTYAWFENNGPLANPIATPASYVVTNGVSIFAEVDNGAIPVNCTNVATVTYTVNSRPDVPLNPIDGIACETGGGVAISVDDPQLVTPNTEIRWSTGGPTLASFVNADPGSGTAGGTNFNTFTPTNSNTATFHAFVINTTSNCFSTTGIPVEHTEDLQPAAAIAGPAQPALCVGSATLAATVATNGGSGTWSVLGQVAYTQDFENAIYVAGVTSTSAAGNGWTIDTSDPNAFPQQGGSGSMLVQAGKRFEVNNTNGDLGGGGGNIAEVAWFSSVIDVSSLTSVDASVDMFDVNGGLDNPDYYNVFYRLNGGGEILFTTNQSEINDFPDQTASVTGLAGGGTLQIIIRIATSGGTETIGFDNVTVKETGSAVTLSDPNLFNATVSSLSQNPPGGVPINYTARWTVESALGACTSSNNDVILTVNALPEVFNQTPELCEDVAGTGLHSGYVLSTSLDALVTNGVAGVTVEWFAGPGLTNQILPATTPQNITNGVGGDFFYRLTSSAPCINSAGTVVFTVNTLPPVTDINVTAPASITFCEDTQGSTSHAGVDLATYNAAINAGATITWYPTLTDAQAPIPTNEILPGAAVGQVGNYTVFDTPPAAPLAARVVDGNSCVNYLEVSFIVTPLPQDNIISGNTIDCSAASVPKVYSVSDLLNTFGTTHDYNWTIDGAGTNFQVFDGAVFITTNNYSISGPSSLVIVQFINAGTFTFTASETIDGCTGNIVNSVVNISGAPPALAFLTPETQVCKDQLSVTYQLTTPPQGGSTYTWDVIGGSVVGGIVSGNFTTITVDWDDLIIPQPSITVTELNLSGCQGAPASINVFLSDLPNMISPNTAAICSGATPSSVLTLNADLPSTFSWRVVGVAGSVDTGVFPGTSVPVFPAAGSTGTGQLTQNLINTSGALGFVTYEVTPTESNAPSPPDCAGPVQTVTITVNPEPVGTAIVPESRCSDVVLGPIYTLSSNVAASTFNITITNIDALAFSGATPVAATGNAANILEDDSWTNTGLLASVITYNVTPVSPIGCVGQEYMVSVNVDPEPVGDAIPTVSRCSDVVLGAAYTLNSNPANVVATTYNITITNPDALAFSGSNLPAATGNAPNILEDDSWTNTGLAASVITYNVVPVSAAGCPGTPYTVIVNIDPIPVGVAIPLSPVCSDVVLGAGFTLSTTGTSAAVNPADGFNITAISISAGVTASAGAPTIVNGQPSTVLTDDAWNNSGLVSANVVYTIIPVSSAAGCLGDPFTVTIQVDPEPVGVAIPATPACSDVVIGAGFALSTTGTSAAVNPANGFNITAITIPAGVTASAGAPAIANGQPSTVLTDDAWNNIGLVSANVVYTIVPVSSAAGCLGDPFTITVQVNPEPVGVVIPVTQVCSDVALGAGFTLNTTGASAAVNPANGFNITAISIPAGVTASAGAPTVVNGQSSTVLIDDAWNNIGLAPANVIYTVVPVSSGAGCLADPFTVTVQVDPEPVGVAIAAIPVCSDDVLGAGFTLSTTGTSAAVNAASGYNITAISIPAGVTASAGAPAIVNGQSSTVLIDDAWNNIGSVPANVVYTIVPVSTVAGCSGDPFTVTVQVDPEPVGVIIAATPICSDVVLGAGFTLGTTGTSAAVNPVNGFNITAITIPAGVTASAGAPAIVNGQSSTVLTDDAWNNIGLVSANVIYTIVPVSSAAGCLGDPFTVTVQVDPEPVGVVIPVTQVCSDVAMGAGFTLNTTGTSAAVNPANGFNITAISIPAGVTASAGAPVVVNGQPSTVLIDDAWNNIGLAPANIVYTIVPVSSGAGCLADAFTVTVQVDPEPVGVAIAAIPVCSDDVLGAGFTLSTTGTSAVVNPTNGFNITAISIPAGVTASAGAPVVVNGQSSTVLIDDAWNNVGLAPSNVVYTVVPVSSGTGCLGDPFTVTVQIDPEPIGIPIAVTPICSDVVLGAGFTLVTTGGSAAVNAASGYNITAINIPAGVTASAGAPAVANAQSSTVLTDDAWNNVGSVSANVVYTIVPVSSGAGCLGDPFTVTVQVDPEPVGVPIAVTPVCSDVVLGAGFTLSTTGISAAVNAADGFNITAISIPAGVSASAGAPAVANGQPSTVLIDDAWNNIGLVSANVVYTVVPVSSGAGCLGDPFTVTVQVDPEPVGVAIAAIPVCSDDVLGVGFTLSTTGTSAAVSAANGYNITVINIPAGVSASAGSPAIANGQSSTVLIDDAWNNAGSTSANVVYTIVPVSSGTGCPGDPFTVTVQVDPEPVGVVIPLTAVCSDIVLGAGFTLTTTGGSALVNPTNGFNITGISIPAGVTASAGAPALANAQSSTVLTDDAWNNIGSVSLNVVYTIVPVALGTACLGDPFTVTVQVDPEPVGIPIAATPVCSDAALGAGFTLSTTGTSAVVSAADGFNIIAISIPAGVTASGGAPAIANAQPSTVLTDDVWNNVGSTLSNVVYTIVPVSLADGCLGDPFTVTVQVDSEPVGVAIPSTPVCSDVVLGAGFTLSTTGTSAAVSAANGYNITGIIIPAGVTASAGAPAAANAQPSTVLTDDAWNNIGSVSANVVYTIVPVSSGAGCLGDPFTVTVQVDPEPVGVVIPLTPVCSDIVLGAGFTLSTTGTSAAVNAANGYNITAISIPAGVSASAGAPVVAISQSSTVLTDDAWNNIGSASANVVYTIVPVASGTNCLGDPFTVTIQVDPEPVGVAIAAIPVCSDDVLGVGFTLSTTGTSAAVSAANGYNITGINIPAGVSASAGAPAIINGQPSTVLTDDAWNNAGSISANVVYTIVPVSSAAGCLGDAFTVTVQVDPEPVGIPIPSTPICSDDLLGVGFTLSTTGGSALVNPADGYNITAISIPIGVTASAGAPVVANAQPSNVLTDDAWNNIGSVSNNVIYTIVPVALGTGCLGDPFTVTVQVDPEPVGIPIVATAVCSDLALGAGFILSTTGTSAGVNAADGFNITGISIPAGVTAIAGAPAVANGQPSTVLTDDVWNNIGSVSANVVYTIVPVSLADGCLGDPFTVTVQVDPEPVGVAIALTPVCSDVALGVGFTLTTTGTSAAVNAANGYNITVISIPAGVTASAGAPVVVNGQSSTVLIDDAWNNIGLLPANVVYTIVPVSSGTGCLGDSFTVTVQVDPEPVGTPIAPVSSCSDVALGVAYTLTSNAGSVAADSYSITITNPAGLVFSGTTLPAATGNAANILEDDSWTNTGLFASLITYNVTPVSLNGCLGDQYAVSVNIEPEPAGTPIVQESRCSDTVLGLTYTLNGNAGSVAANTFNIAITNPNGLIFSGGTLPLAVGNAGNILEDDSWTNTGLFPSVITYTVTPVSLIGCLGDPYAVSVSVDPEPVGANVVNNRCSDEAFGAFLTLSTSGAAVPASTYNIVISNPGGLIFSGGTPAAATGNISTILTDDSWTNTSSLPAVVTYSINPVSGSGCIGESFTVAMTINPEPTAPALTTVEHCSDAVNPFTFDLQTLVAAGNNVNSVFSYTVSSTNSLTVFPESIRNTATNAIISQVYTNFSSIDETITYEVTPFSSPEGCEGTSFKLGVVVHPEPVGSNVVDPVCSTSLNHDLQTQITNPAPGLGSVFTYTFTADVGNPTVLPLAPAIAPYDRPIASAANITDQFSNTTGAPATVTYTVIPFNAANSTCGGTPFTYQVIISPNPTGVSGPEPSVCSDIPFIIDPQNNVIPAVTSTFTWTAVYNGLTIAGALPPASGSGVISTFLTNETNIIRDAVYTVVPTAGTCVGSPFVITISVLPEPVMAPALATPASVCSDNPDLATASTINVVLNTNGTSIAADDYIVSVKSVDTGLIPVISAAPMAPATITFPAVAGLSSDIATDRYTNTTATPLTVVYTVIPVTGTCQGDSFDITVTINPEPVINPALDNTVCSRDLANIILSTNGTSVAATTYRLISVNVPATITAAGTNTPAGTTGDINLIKNDTYTNTTNALATVTYEIRGTGPGPLSCEGESEFIILTVDPEPIMVPGSAMLCSDVPSGIIVGPQLLPTPSATITQYELKAIVKAGSLIAGGSNAGLGTYPANLAGGQSDFLAADVFTNTTTGPLLVTYTVAPIASGCRGVDQTVVFTVDPAPALADLNTTVCSDDILGTNITLGTLITGPPAVQYDVIDIRINGAPGELVPDPGNAIITAVPTFDVLYIQSDSWRNTTNNPLTVEYDIQPISAAPCTGPMTTVIVTVEPELTMTVPGDENICSEAMTSISLSSLTVPTSGTVTFDVQATPIGAITGAAFLRTNISNGFILEDELRNLGTGVGEIQYTITPKILGAKNGLGCSAGTPTVVSVFVEPEATGSFDQIFVTICEGESLGDLDNFISTTKIPSGAGTVEFEVTNVFASDPAVTGYVSGTVLTSVSNELTDILNITDGVGITTDQTVTYQLTPRIVGSNAGTCVGDPNSIELIVTVRPRAVVMPSELAVELCSGESYQIDLPNDLTGGTAIASWTVVDNPQVEGEFSGLGNLLFLNLINNSTSPQTLDYVVTPQSLFDASCTGPDVTISVTVNPSPDVIVADSEVERCSGDLANILLDGNVIGSRFEWEATVLAGTVEFDAIGATNVSGSGTNDDFINHVLTNTGSSQAVIRYEINAFFDKTPPITGNASCNGFIPGFVTMTLSPEVTASIVPHSTDGTNTRIRCIGSVEAVQFAFTGAFPFTLTLDVTDENGNTTREVINNLPSQYAELASASRTYQIVQLEDANGCIVTSNESLQVIFEQAEADFTINGSKNPASVMLGLTTGTATVDIVINNFIDANNYTLQIGDDILFDDQISANFQYTFTSPSTFGTLGYAVELQVEAPTAFNCNDVENLFIKVLPSQPTVIGVADILEGCSPLTVNFEAYREDLSLSTNIVVENLSWQIDNTRIEAPNPTFTFADPGIYTVTVTGDNGHGDSETDEITINVYEAPLARFEMRPSTVVFVPDDELFTFNFTDTGTGTGSEDGFGRSRSLLFEWDFGDGTDVVTGDGESPDSFHTYELESTDEDGGVWPISLTATFDYGSISCTSVYRDSIRAEFGGTVATPNAFTPDPNGSNGGDLSGFDNDQGENVNNVFIPRIDGVLADGFLMQIYDRWGVLIFESTSANIGWDGYFQGKLMPQGVYVYKLDLKLANGEREVRIGDITLLK